MGTDRAPVENVHKVHNSISSVHFERESLVHGASATRFNSAIGASL